MARPATLPGLVWLGLGLITLPAAAQSPGFHDLLRAGVEHRRAQREAEAFAAFSAAWEQCRCPEARVQMALAAQALGRWCDAAALLDEALGSAGDPFVEGLRPRLTEERRALDAHVGSLRVEVDSPSALVSLDGAPIASAPAVQCAPAGPHALTVTAPGRVALTRALVVEPGARLDLGLALRPLPAPPPLPSPWPARARTARWITLGAGALGLAAAGTATALEAAAVGRWNDDARCLAGGLSRAENCGGDLATADRAHAVAVAGYVTAGALAAVTTVLWVLSPRRPVTRERSRATCLPDLRATGVTCAGVF